MDCKVILSNRAIQDLEEVVQYISMKEQACFASNM